MRMIQVSTDLYAKIWSCREAGEESENQILRRLLDIEVMTSVEAAPSEKKSEGSAVGYRDNRNDVTFEEGFMIHRPYKGRNYSAIATGGRWLRNDNGKSYRSLNQLNQSIAGGQANVWHNGWHFTENGRDRPLNTMRLATPPTP